MSIDQSGLLTKEFVFKGRNSGVSRKNSKEYDMIELHDPITLENSNFFVRPELPISTDGLVFKDRVVGTFGMEILYGRPQLSLSKLVKK